MKIQLTLEVDDPDDIDPTHSTGITSDAYDHLSEALADAGFSIFAGPHVADPE